MKLAEYTKKEVKKRAGSGLGTVWLTYVFTNLWFIVSGVVYSGIYRERERERERERVVTTTRKFCKVLLQTSLSPPHGNLHQTLKMLAL